MSQVVQTVCPGCSNVLRVPAEWTHQPMRCKKCGTVMVAKAPASKPAPPTSVSPSKPTPPPPPRKQAAPPPPAPVTAAPVAAPVAAPITRRDSLDFRDQDDDRPSRRRRKPQSSGIATWITLGVVGLILVGGGVAAALNFDRIKQFANNLGKPPRDDNGEPKKAEGKDKGKSVAVGKAGFPRRALVISVHNYLYANPITTGSTGSPDVNRLLNSLSTGLNVPLTQVTHLSDANLKTPRPPLRGVIEETVKNFLATTRKQDRILLFWIGHTKEIEGKAYLVPLEGEFDDAETLLPLSWLFEELGKCECRQKVLVLDGNRHNLAQGEERPVSGPMTEAFVKALEAAPKGVQVWAACGKDQESNEFEGYPLGAFLDSFREALTPEKGNKGALEGRFQKPDEPIPVDVLHKWVSDQVAAKVKANESKLVQTPLLIGKEPEEGAEYDAAEAAAKAPALPAVNTANQKFVRELLDEISLPSLRGGEGTGADLSFGNLPPFPADVMKKYDGSLPADSPLRKAISKGRATLWAISTASVPGDVVEEAQKIRAKLRFDLSIMKYDYTKPGGGPAEQTFRNTFEGKSRDMSRIIAQVEAAMEELEAAKELRDAEETPARWKAHYDYILARFKGQLAFLEEYNNLLGGMRKELPTAEATHVGWKMASKERPGDSAGKKHEKAARKLYETMTKENKQTPWEVLGKREKLNALGLEWQAY